LKISIINIVNKAVIEVNKGFEVWLMTVEIPSQNTKTKGLNRLRTNPLMA
jgi:hypothetical protein